MAPGPQSPCSAFIAMSTKCSTFGTTPKHVASCGYVEMRDKIACSGVIHSPVMGHVTLTRISSKLTAAKSLPRPSRDCGRRSRKTSVVMELQRTSCHDLTCGAVCLSNIASRCCDTRYSLCAFLSNMRQNWHARSGIIVVFLHCDGRHTSHPFAVCVPVNASCEYVS